MVRTLEGAAAAWTGIAATAAAAAVPAEMDEKGGARGSCCLALMKDGMEADGIAAGGGAACLA